MEKRNKKKEIYRLEKNSKNFQKKGHQTMIFGKNTIEIENYPKTDVPHSPNDKKSTKDSNEKYLYYSSDTLEKQKSERNP